MSAELYVVDGYVDDGYVDAFFPAPVYPWQPNYGQKVTFSTYSFRSQAIAAWGEEWGERDTVYEWSNGRYMEDSLKGPYAIAGE